MNEFNIFYEGKIEKENNLNSIKTQDIVKTIKEDLELKNQIALIRKVGQIDKNAYTRQKTRLPFFIGAEFKNNRRKLDHLIRVNAIILDIDNCFQDLPFDDEIIADLMKDRRVLLLFKSPSGKGLKIVFLLDKPICSPSLYTEFFRTFSYRFSTDYQLQSFYDKKTTDASRVCFYSYDPDVYYNPNAVPIQVQDYLPITEEPKVSNTIGENANKICTQVIKTESKHKTTKPEYKEGHPDDEEYASILNKLGNKPVVKKINRMKSPEEITQLMPLILDQFNKFEIQLEEEVNIQYGKKIRFLHRKNWAEVNIFFGKKGFSVVLTPKTGSHIDLGEVGVKLIHEAISELWLKNEVGTIELEGGKEYYI